MNQTEELLKFTLQHHAEDAPVVTELHATKRLALLRRSSWFLPAGAAVAAAIIVAVVAVFSNAIQSSDSPMPASTPDVTQLTGKDVGIALGLEPLYGSVAGCARLTEFQDGAGFCLEGVTDDPLEEELLSLQIHGYERNDALIQYARLSIEYGELMNGRSINVEELDALNKRMAELAPYLIKPGG